MGAAGPACAAREPLSREPLSREPPARSVLRHVRLENLAAGMSGGVLSTLALHPLDLVKIRFAGEAGPAAVLRERRTGVPELAQPGPAPAALLPKARAALPAPASPRLGINWP